MTLPERVVIGHRTYTLLMDDELMDREQPEDVNWQAFSEPRRQVIALRSDAGPDDERDSVLHEVLHQCLRASGWNCPQAEEGPDVEEVMIGAMVGPLLRVLRENPDLLTYLLDRSGKTSVLSP